MNANSKQLPDWVPEALRDDPKKLVFLAVLSVVFVIVMAKTFLSSGPSSASAAVVGNVTVIPGTSDNSSNNTSSTNAQAVNLSARNWLKEPIIPVKRDLFAIRMDDYPLASGKSATLQNTGKTGIWGGMEKSESDPADLNKQRNDLISELQTQASRLKLQSTLVGSDPRAIVDGVTVREGQTISTPDGAEFKVVKIGVRRMVVEREGVRLELRMPD